MKKLLLILLCLPLLFSTCKKEDEEPTTNNNGNNGDTFLSINDGSVWTLNTNKTYRESSSISNYGAIYCPEIGFYNSDYFFIHKENGHSCLSFNCCVWYSEGLVNGEDGFDVSITKNTDVELWIEKKFVLGKNEFLTMQHKFTLISDNQLKIITNMIDSPPGWNVNDYFSDISSPPQYIKSTETNLSCN